MVGTETSTHNGSWIAEVGVALGRDGSDGRGVGLCWSWKSRFGSGGL